MKLTDTTRTSADTASTRSARSTTINFNSNFGKISEQSHIQHQGNQQQQQGTIIQKQFPQMVAGSLPHGFQKHTHHSF